MTAKTRRRDHHPRAYAVVTTHDASLTLGEGDIRRFESILEASKALVHSTAPYCAIVYDDGHHEARELNDRETAVLDRVLAAHDTTLDDCHDDA